MRGIGLEPNDSSPTDEKLGEKRLGPTEPFSSLGFTLFLASTVFLLLIMGVIVASIIIKRNKKVQDKCRERLAKLKKKIFFNPIVRYLTLNCLKLSIAGLVAFKAAT